MQRRLPDRTTSRVLATASLALSLAACATVETAVVANPGTTFQLGLGQTATVTGSNVRITFTRVSEDSRCPVDVTCVWAGDAKIELSVAHDGSAEKRTISITEPNNVVSVGDLTIRFVALAPVPRQSEPSSSRAYVAQLTILVPYNA